MPWKYWLTVVLVSVVGTQITDALTDGLGVSLYCEHPGVHSRARCHFHGLVRKREDAFDPFRL